MENFLRIDFYEAGMNFHVQPQGGVGFRVQFVHSVPMLNKWTLVEVDQHRVAGDAGDDERFLLKIHIGETQIYSEIFQYCKDFSNVKVYTGPINMALVASIKDLVIETDTQSPAA